MLTDIKTGEIVSFQCEMSLLKYYILLLCIPLLFHNNTEARRFVTLMKISMLQNIQCLHIYYDI